MWLKCLPVYNLNDCWTACVSGLVTLLAGLLDLSEHDVIMTDTNDGKTYENNIKVMITIL